MSENDLKDINKVLDFWFGSKGNKNYLKIKSFWYGSSQSDDDLVRKHLAQYYENARNGRLDHWIETGGEGALALILVLDQVPRNIFRDKPEAYITDAKALSVAKIVVEKGWDKQMCHIFRRYIYAPFNHSENFDDQKMSLQLYTQLGDTQHLYWAQNHYDLIKKFGRFPHRDRILRRHLDN